MNPLGLCIVYRHCITNRKLNIAFKKLYVHCGSRQRQSYTVTNNPSSRAVLSYHDKFRQPLAVYESGRGIATAVMVGNTQPWNHCRLKRNQIVGEQVPIKKYRYCVINPACPSDGPRYISQSCFCLVIEYLAILKILLCVWKLYNKLCRPSFFVAVVKVREISTDMIYKKDAFLETNTKRGTWI